MVAWRRDDEQGTAASLVDRPGRRHKTSIVSELENDELLVSFTHARLSINASVAEGSSLSLQHHEEPNRFCLNC